MFSERIKCYAIVFEAKIFIYKFAFGSARKVKAGLQLEFFMRNNKVW